MENALRRREEKHTRSVGYINKKPLPVEIRKAAVNLEFNVYLINEIQQCFCKGSLFVLLRKIFDVYLHIIN